MGGGGYISDGDAIVRVVWFSVTCNGGMGGGGADRILLNGSYCLSSLRLERDDGDRGCRFTCSIRVAWQTQSCTYRGIVRELPLTLDTHFASFGIS